MAICLLCRFYHYTLEDIKELTLQEFNILSENMVKIIKIENPDPDEKKIVSAEEFKKILSKKKNKVK